ncbi:MAG: alpha-amylase family glycosyl hydrolase [Microthrixaceae bacterium]
MTDEVDQRDAETVPDSELSASPWWQEAVVYQIYPRSFADSNGDGVGDLQGILAHLDHLAELGVDAIWLSPTQPSPMADNGYDISDYCDIDPVFGTLGDFDALLDAVHARGMRLVIDYVPNHTSDEHPWFRNAVASVDSSMRDRYVWRDPGPDGEPPNNWLRAFSPEPAWTLDQTSGQYYLHLFLPEQPYLNWRNYDVQREMAGVLEFWMDRGVDGFRADVVHCIGKGQDLADASPELAGLPACIFDHGPGTHDMLRMLRKVVDGDRPGAHLLLGETAVFDREQQLSYLGTGDELHLAFNFLALHASWDAARWRGELEATYGGHDRIGAWPTWVMSNHDLPRHRTRYGNEARARAAAVLLLTLRGTPFLYQGEELGLQDAVVPPEAVVDPGGRDGCRAPIPWTDDPTGGWGPNAWLPSPPDAGQSSAAAERADPDSMLAHYRRLLSLRSATDALRVGDIELLDAPEGALRFLRRLAGGVAADSRADPAEIEVAVNFTAEKVAGPFAGGDVIGGTTAPGELGPIDPATALGPDEARIVAIDGGASLR